MHEKVNDFRHTKPKNKNHQIPLKNYQKTYPDLSSILPNIGQSVNHNVEQRLYSLNLGPNLHNKKLIASNQNVNELSEEYMKRSNDSAMIDLEEEKTISEHYKKKNMEEEAENLLDEINENYYHWKLGQIEDEQYILNSKNKDQISLEKYFCQLKDQSAFLDSNTEDPNKYGMELEAGQKLNFPILRAIQNMAGQETMIATDFDIARDSRFLEKQRSKSCQSTPKRSRSDNSNGCPVDFGYDLYEMRYKTPDQTTSIGRSSYATKDSGKGSSGSYYRN